MIAKELPLLTGIKVMSSLFSCINDGADGTVTTSDIGSSLSVCVFDRPSLPPLASCAVAATTSIPT